MAFVLFQKSGDQSETAKKPAEKSDSMPVVWFCLILSALGIVVSCFWGQNGTARATAIEWSMACFLSGCVIGFLFAIPKNDSSAHAAGNGTGAAAGTSGTTSAPYKPLINNNLVEISDWLTKIIVGLGLVQLTKFPVYMKGLGTDLAMGFAPPNKATGDLLAFAYALIVGYFILGFLFAYLIMRLYLSGEIIKADQKNYATALEDKVNAMNAKVDNLESTQNVLSQQVNENVNVNQPVALAAKNKGQLLDKLWSMANDYMNIRIADWGARVQKKEDQTSAMVSFASNNAISKDNILELYANKPNEGLLIVLATLIIMNPENGDVDRLLKYADKINSKHIRYRTLSAIAKLLERKLIAANQVDIFKKLVDNYRNGADNSLLSKIKEIASLLGSYQPS